MPFMPFSILGMWFRGLLGIAILAGGAYLLKSWYDNAHVDEPVRVEAGSDGRDGLRFGDGVEGRRPPVERHVFRYEVGFNRETARLAGALALLTLGLFGRLILQGASSLASAGGSSASSPGRGSARSALADDPKGERGGEVHTLNRPDGSVLRAECYGPAGAPPVVFTHGWGANSTEWFYVKRALAGRFRVIVWDEPGLGLSKKPDNNNYSMENLAADLDAVLALAGGRPAVLVGHSIGGMITLTYAKAFPEALGSKVSGIVLVHTTYTNPVRTTKMAGLYTAIEKPVIVPLLYLTIALWPLVWVMNWLSYVNGSAYRSTKSSSFAGTETPGQVDFVARFMPHARPDVLARGMLGMLAYDATGVLPAVGVPALVVAGDLDTTTLPEASQYMASHLARGKLVTLSPARHMGLVEHHGEFDRLVSEFAHSCADSALVR